MMLKTLEVVVKVTRGFAPEDGQPVPALVTRRGRPGVEMYLSPETLAAMDGQLVAYFSADVVDGHIWIGQRLPDGNRGW